MDRRAFVSALAGGLVTAPLVVTGQPGRKDYRIGYLLLAPRDVQLYLTSAFEAGLRARGYTPGGDVVIEYRSADGHVDRLPELAVELVHLKVDVVVTGVNPAASAAKRATGTIPIVMSSSFFPVE
ncbi:MAG TPA: ABC transporter substrate binding protein, partial [Casimicrobiaceae bacterium]|nr:ABC transporter substrate binding protein [Casimicrobiaceae bacterium]